MWVSHIVRNGVITLAATASILVGFILFYARGVVSKQIRGSHASFFGRTQCYNSTIRRFFMVRGGPGASEFRHSGVGNITLLDNSTKDPPRS